MTSTFSWLRHKSLFLTFFSLGISAYAIIPAIAQIPIIRNTAGAGANNLQQRQSNEVRLRATQAALEIIKIGDRAAAEPGDTVIYRLAIRNTGNATANNLTITDRLPLGLRFISKSLKGSIGNTSVALTSNVSSNNRTVTITSGVQLPANQTLNVVYAAEVTPDAVRGNGRNLAQAQAGALRSNQASHILRIRPGIVSDCGIIIGRVFVDKNFDGEQQKNEPGIPNAVIYMDDGNRIVTDAKGLFSLANVVSGYRSATLDLTSLPGYALAPNKYFIERNSQSRMVKLAPSSMARINFGVKPAFSEDKR